MEARINALNVMNAPGASVLTVQIDPRQGAAAENVAERFKPDKEFYLEIKERRKKRSLNANGYAWALIDKIADTLGRPKEEVYIDLLRDYGQTATDADGNKIVFSVKSEIKVLPVYKYLVPIGTGYVGEHCFTHYRALKGSSEYDSKEMSVFIDGIVYEAKELGIETLTPSAIAELKAAWNGKEELAI